MQIFIVDCGGAVTAATNYILHVFVFAFSSLDQHFGKQRYIYQKTVFLFDNFFREKYTYSIYFEEKFCAYYYNSRKEKVSSTI